MVKLTHPDIRGLRRATTETVQKGRKSVSFWAEIGLELDRIPKKTADGKFV